MNDIRGRVRYYLKDPIWIKILSLGIILFLIFLADAILSFWVPNQLENVYADTSKVGLIISASSVVGLLADLILPQLISGITVRKLVLSGIIVSAIFSLLLYSTTFIPLLLVFLTAMAVWGLYYEFLGFAQQQFVADSTPLKLHSATWGILGVFKSLSYFLGPLIASPLFGENGRAPLYIALLLLASAFVILQFHKGKHEHQLEIDVKRVSLYREFEHWYVLFKHVWPVLLISIFLGLIDAFFWTIGPILTESLAKESWLGNAFLSTYTFPSLFMGFVIAKMGIFKGKKRKATYYMLGAGAVLALLSALPFVVWKIFIVLVSSLFLSAAYPLTDGVYSDIVARMGRQRTHMIGLSNSTMSIAYIAGPVISGYVARLLGEEKSFVIIGLLTVAMALFLLATTPKKLLLPQGQIKKWKE